MLSPDMPRPLTALLVSVLFLAGCVTQPPPKEIECAVPEVPKHPTVEQWLKLESEVASLEEPQVEERLAQVDRSDGIGQQYYFALLNQRMPTYGAWTLARDTFQRLEENEELPVDNRRLAGLLRKYNQSRINAYLRQQTLAEERSQMEAQLQEASDEKLLLQQKIQALTELETVISTRKEE